MSQYGTQTDPSKVWGLAGGVTPLIPPPSSQVQKPLGSPYNGLGGYRSVNGNQAGQNNHLPNHWSGIRLPTAPSGPPPGTHPQWDHYRSGVAATTASSGPYLTSPTSLGPGPHQGWYPHTAIPQNKLPHRPQPAFPSPTMQDETSPYHNPFSSAGDMALMAARASNAPSHHNSVVVSTSVPPPPHSQVYLPTPQSAPTPSLGEFLPPPRINYQHGLELDMLRSLQSTQHHQPQSHSISAPQSQVSPAQQPRQFWSPPAQRLPSMSGAFAPLNGSSRAHEIKSELHFSPPPNVSVAMAHSTTTEQGLLAVRSAEEQQQRSYMTGGGHVEASGDHQRSSSSRTTPNGLSSPRVSNSAQEVTTTIQHSAPQSPQYQQISPATSTPTEEDFPPPRQPAIVSLAGDCGEGEEVEEKAVAQVSTPTQESSPSCLPDEAVSNGDGKASDGLHPQVSGNPQVINSCADPQSKAQQIHTDRPTEEHSGPIHSNQLHDTGADISTQEDPEPDSGGEAKNHGLSNANPDIEPKEESVESPEETDVPTEKVQEPRSPKLESQEGAGDNEEDMGVADDDEITGKPLVVDTEMHEPITPEEISPDPEASNSSLGGIVGSLAFNPSDTNRRAALILEQKIQSESVPISAGFIPSVTSVTRPPGLRPPLGFPLISPTQPLSANSPLRMSPATTTGAGGTVQNTYTCPICGFTSTSKFHFNSHMNTHTDHQCSMCDYTARTEGRLKRHMKEFHSPAEQIAAGVAPSGELLEAPQMPSSQSGTPSALEQMQQALARSQEAFAQHSSQSAGSGSEAGTPPKEGERKQSTSSKPKHYRCKQCTHLSSSKEESWQHARSHIKPDKLLTCPQCEFVTEYKHHLEYHLRNHFGSKPFRCNKCNYSCVNKSMLNSHMKSHSSFYQFRCRDCTYATKYCHSLKLHLRKYGHHPQNIDLPDGTTLDVNAADLDMFGTVRRGPRPKKTDSASPPFVSPLTVSGPSGVGGANLPFSSEPSPVMANPAVMAGMSSLVTPNLLEALRFQQISGAAAMAKSIATLGAQLPTIQGDRTAGDSGAGEAHGAVPQEGTASAGVGGSHQKCNMCGYRSTSQQDYVQHLFMHRLESVNFYNNTAATTAAAAQAIFNQQGNAARAQALNREEEGSEEHSPSVQGRISPSHEGSQGSSGSPISGSKGSGDEGSNGTPGEIQTGGSSRRKGKAYKLDRIALRLQGRMSPSPHSSGHEETEVMDVQAQDHEDSVEQSEVGMETVESVVSSVIQSQPQHTLIPPKYSSAEEIRSHPSLQAAYDALKSVVEKQQTESEEQKEKEAAAASGSGASGGGGDGGGTDWGTAFVCDHCQIAFKNAVMYHIHMGYHGYDNPFRCNRCGQLCQDSLGMFMHIAQAKH